jgi:hypothetical protein
VDSWEREKAYLHRQDLPPTSYLAISGGGDNGAFTVVNSSSKTTLRIFPKTTILRKTTSILPPLLTQFGHFIGVEFAQAQLDRGKKMYPRLDEHQGFGGGFDRALPSIDRMDIVNDINACCEFLGDQSARDAASFLWRARPWKRPQQDPV